MTSASVPQVIALDGGFASVPVVENNHVYVTTTDFGNAMMQGNYMFDSKFANYNFNLRNLRAFPTTDTELKLIAAAAKIGLRRMPLKG